jgi:uncharacterized paraquat-inducible protein A
MIETGIGDLKELHDGSKMPCSGVIRMMFDRGSVACPACSSPVGVSRFDYHRDFPCPHCGEALKVLPLYAQLVVWLSILLGFALAWEIGTLGPVALLVGVPRGFFLLCLPLTILVLTLLVRVVPFLVRPTLVLPRFVDNHFTTLNLSPRPKDDPKN